MLQLIPCPFSWDRQAADYVLRHQIFVCQREHQIDVCSTNWLVYDQHIDRRAQLRNYIRIHIYIPIGLPLLVEGVQLLLEGAILNKQTHHDAAVDVDRPCAEPRGACH